MIAPRRYGLLAAGAALVWLSLRGGAADTGRAAVVSGAIARSSEFQASRANVERDADRPQLAVSAAPVATTPATALRNKLPRPNQRWAPRAFEGAESSMDFGPRTTSPP